MSWTLYPTSWILHCVHCAATPRESHFKWFCLQSLVVNEYFQHILRVLNTNVDGKQKIMFALTSIKGIGRQFTNICSKIANVDMNKRNDHVISCYFLIGSLRVRGQHTKTTGRRDKTVGVSKKH
ncbi:hypothetical protein GYH30_018659 [Glycine max]|uniref:40S ribosomal protein S18 n=2 Tax=Glycine subgen. Soja TaxID=1462606 RepID=A0A0R0J4C2_SOYBN|nr:hypothetical protein GYH30_018659 [Glycine max]RZC03263.1 40S ribosomal protein S18 [Glycine soja]